MRQPNARLAEARQRKEDHLPHIARLSLAGETTREIAAKTGVPKTTVIRWRQSLRRDCATMAVAETMEIVDEMVDGYRAVYREGMEGWQRSQADKETRTLIDCPADDAKNRRSVRTETRAGNPACLGQARGALDSICKLLGLDAPAQLAILEEEKAPYNLEEMTLDEIKQLPTKDLHALVAYCTAVVEIDRRGEDDPDGVHGVHEAGLPDELAPPEAGGEAGPGGDAAVPAADGVPAPAAREERTGEPPLPGVPPRPESGPAADWLLPHQPPGNQHEPRRAADHDQPGLRGPLSPNPGEEPRGPLDGAHGGPPHHEPVRV
jgi:hypothetical protein